MFTKTVIGPYSEIKVGLILRRSLRNKKRTPCAQTTYVCLSVLYLWPSISNRSFRHIFMKFDIAFPEKVVEQTQFSRKSAQWQSFLTWKEHKWSSVIFNLSWEIWRKFGIEGIRVVQFMKLVLVKAILDYGLNEILPIFSPFFCPTWKNFNAEHSVQCH